jgi:hypothetical protein
MDPEIAQNTFQLKVRLGGGVEVLDQASETDLELFQPFLSVVVPKSETVNQTCDLKF